MSIASTIRERLGRLSGDKKDLSPKKSDRSETDCDTENQDGGKFENASGGSQSPGLTKKGKAWHCKQCHVYWDDDHKNKPDLAECSFCRQWVCRSCTRMKKTDFSALSRNDIFWACATCMPRACKQVLNDTSDEDETIISSQISRIEVNLETKLAKVVNEEIPKAINECLQVIKEDVSSTVQNNMTRLWSEVVGSPPTTSNSNGTKSGEPTTTIENVVKKAIREQKTEEIQRESRANNFIIYRAPESTKKEKEEIKIDDCKIVQDLLEEIEINEAPNSITRLGRYKNPEEGEDIRPRPIKIAMKNSEECDMVMRNLKKLNKAPDHIKVLGVAYDMTQEEREVVRKKVNEAREKSEQSTNWTFKIRGPPWALREIRIRKTGN